MKREELFKKVDVVKNGMRVALQIMYNVLNQGQQKQIVKNEVVKALFDRYGVYYKG